MNLIRVSEQGYGVQVHERILELEHQMRTQPQVVIEPQHFFADHIYARPILIPKGTLLTGKIHRQTDLQIMVSGDIAIMTEDGFKRFRGYNIFPGKAHTKMMGYAVEDTQWVTVHGTDETDLDRLEEQLYYVEPRMFDYKTGEVVIDVELAHADFQLMLEELGVTAELVEDQSKEVTDLTIIELQKVVVAASCIQGNGVLATEAITAGELVGPARLQGLRTQLGRFVNHYPLPNCEMRWMNETSIGLFTLREIRPGDELLVDYRQSVNLIKGGAR